MSIIEKINAAETAKLTEGKTVPEFGPGDTLRVRVRVTEGNRERVQAFEGVCIARKNAGVNSSFTVRKISYGEGVERVFPLYSPQVDGIDVIRRGRVRRAKLYYLRGRRGKAARIVERTGQRQRGAAKAAEVATAEEAYAMEKTAAGAAEAESAAIGVAAEDGGEGEAAKG